MHMVFFPAEPYTPHKAKPYFVDVSFIFVQTTVFFFPLLYLSHNLSQIFINVQKLNFVLEHNVYFGH